MRRRCVDALFGRRGSVRLSVLTDEEEMREMTKCEEFPNGLDLSSGDYTARQVVYDLRNEIAENPGLFFIGEKSIGLKWTAYDPRGMAWRIGEFSERAQSIVHEIAAWAALAAARNGNPQAAKKFQEIGRIFRQMEAEIRESVAKAEAALELMPGAQMANDDAEEAA